MRSWLRVGVGGFRAYYGSRMSTRTALLVVPLVGLLLGVAGCAAQARPPQPGAEPSPGPTASAAVPRAELLRRQERLGAVARDIQDLVDPYEGPVAEPLPSGPDRYGEVRIDAERDRVELWWAGPLPKEVRAVLARHPDVTVELHRAEFSSNELRAAADVVAKFLRGGRLGADVTTDAITSDVRRGRLTVHVIDPADTWTVDELHRRLDPLTPVPLDILHQRRPTLVPL